MAQHWIDFRKVKELAEFEPVLARYNVSLVGGGPQRTALCIFHEEKKPSLKINLDRKVFHCFGCGASGNILDFVSRAEKCSVADAAAIVVEVCNLDLKSETKPRQEKARKARGEKPERSKTPVEKPAAETANDLTDDAQSEALNPPLTFTLRLEADHPYLAERGVGPEIVKTFGLGFCNRGLMKGRICIPIYDHEGRLVAYAGRWPGESPEGQERYKLPAGFKKTAVLFNLNRVRDAKHLVFVEGYFGVFKLHALGIPSVALMGRAIHAAQVERLGDCKAERVTVLMDGDEPGRLAVPEIVSMLAQKLFVRVLDLPEGEQPDTVSEEWLAPLRGLT